MYGLLCINACIGAIFYFYPMKNWLLCVLHLFTLHCWAQGVDFTRMVLTLELDTVKSEVDGLVSLNFIHEGEVDSIFLNGIEMNYREVMLNGSYVDYESNEEGIWLKPDRDLLQDTNRIFISYTARPRKGIYFIGWGDTTQLSRRQIWTQGQGIDHRHWIPHRDDQTDKLVTDITVIFDSTYNVVSNGRLVGHKQVEGGKIMWHYVMTKPMSSYLLALAIGDYDSTLTHSESGTPLIQYYYPERENDYPFYYYRNEEIHNFLEEEIGVDFPWQNYKQIPVQDFRHGAMENTTATIFGDFFLVDPVAFNDRNYTYVNAHELAHQWFGNVVTAESSLDHWLHEGFATYYQWLSERNLYGEDFFDWTRYEAAEMVAEASKIDTIALGNIEAGSNRFYQKGAWVLHMLEQKLGRDDFRKAMRHYLESNKFGVVTTASLSKAIQEATGYDARKFFSQWVKTPAEPIIRIKHLSTNDTSLFLKIEQDSNLPGFPFEIDARLKLVYEEGDTEIKDIKLTQSSEQFRFDLKRDTSLLYWNFDPDMNILGLVGENKPVEMSLKQLELDSNLLDRYEAILYLNPEPLSSKREMLTKAFQNEDEHYSVRAEALKQILKEQHPEHKQFLEAALTSKDVQLQKKAIEHVRRPDSSMREILAALRKGRSYELREKAVHVSINNNDPSANQWLYDSIYRTQPGIPGYQLRTTVLLYRVAIFKDKEAFNELVSYTSPGYDFITRINAMQALRPIGILTEDLITNLFDAMFNPNWKLRKEAIALLQEFYRERESRQQLTKYIQKHQSGWEDFQKRRIKRTFGANIL